MKWMVVTSMALGIAFLGCKQPEATRDPQTLERLERCSEDQDDKDRYIEELEKRLAEFELAGDGAVVVKVEGDELTISGRGPAARAEDGAAGDADDRALYEAFVQRTRSAREAITRCYQNALKNDASLQSRTIQLEVEVDYGAGGQVTGARFEPNVSPEFGRCMQAVTQGWDIPASPRPVSFMRRITLAPE